jgi:hypothetical protein
MSKDYIERGSLEAKAVYMHGFGKNKYVPLKAIQQATAADVVARAAYDQVSWERDLAIEQLREDYGVGLGEKKPADVVAVKHEYHPGDVCIYGFGSENKSCAIVEIVRVLNDERGVAEVKFLKVFVDDTGNGFFNYLLRSGNTMNASFKYLKNITPNCGAKMDGE